MKVLILGGGPSGIMAAIGAAGAGHEVTILEKNNQLGRKLFITGKGRCNLTNNADIEDLLNSVVHNRDFLYSAFYTFSNLDLLKFFEDNKLKLKVERGQRVFPQSDKSSDVIRTLKRKLEELKVTTIFESEVTEITREENRITGFKVANRVYRADHYIVAAGGASYPLTGSDGKVLKLLSNLAIKTHEFRPSLIPMVLRDNVSDLAGLSLKNVSLTLKRGKKKVFSDLGEMLFTHDGISGPLVLSASSFWQEDIKECYIDLKPGMTIDEVDNRLIRDFSSNSNKSVINALHGITVASLIPILLDKAKIDPNKQSNSVTREERRELVKNLKELSFTIKGLRPIEEAIISRGGVDIDEINPSTMRVKSFDNLSICGEIIDVDALTGGFNLQIAFSTGFLAGSFLAE